VAAQLAVPQERLSSVSKQVRLIESREGVMNIV
jgi:hypothetical protein